MEARTILGFALVAVLGLYTAFSQDGEVTIATAESDTLGTYLVDGEGNSLYLYLQDSAGVSTCLDRCPQNWPPLTVEGEPVAGDGVDAGLLGTLEREDRQIQVTYNGWPLYYYIRDADPGTTRGQALGEMFYLVTPAGEAALPPVPEVPAETEEGDAPAEAELDEETAALVAEGQPIFTINCAACHGAEGQGIVGPRLAGNSQLANTSFVTDMILNGFPDHGMPAFRDQFTDEQIAAVATFIRNSWSNAFGHVTPEEVSARR
jgi:mono/diheme cytochrome c family protein